MPLPDISIKCRNIAAEGGPDVDYKLCCLSVDDSSFEEFRFRPDPEKPEAIKMFESLNREAQEDHVKKNPRFWTDEDSVSGRYLNDKRYAFEANEGHKYSLMKFKKIFIKYRDEARFNKCKDMLATYPKQVVVVDAISDLSDTLKQFNAKVTKMGEPRKKVFGYDD